jgi:uncharacterized protein
MAHMAQPSRMNAPRSSGALSDTNTNARSLVLRRGDWLGLVALLAVAVAGLFYVKWHPSYDRAFAVAVTHSLGASIVSGREAAPPAPSWAAALDYARQYFTAIWQAMVLGLVLAASIETFLPHNWLVRILGSATFRHTALGGVLALPGMMCTCCASPVAVSMRKKGVSQGAALAFWLSNPTLNPAVLVFIVFTLGWGWALLRLSLGLVLVFGVPLLATAAFGQRVRPELPARLPSSAGAPFEPEEVAEAALEEERAPWAVRWLKALARLSISLLPEYIVVMLALGAARAWLFPAVGAGADGGPFSGQTLFVIGALATAGALFAIPTAGEIPIVQTMRSFGLGAGPAGALLLTLAPISLPSLLMIGRAFPRRVVALVLAATVALGIVAGLLAIALGL